MSSELTPEELALVAELVGRDILRADLAALESSVRDFRRGMADLKAKFGAPEVFAAGEGREAGDE